MNRKYGFTLIEILVGAILIALFFGITISSMRGFSGQKELEAYKDQFITTLELAKQKARSGDEQDCTTLLNYSVTIKSEISYEMNSVCASGNGSLHLYIIPEKSNVQITDYTNATMTFKNLTGLSNGNCVIISDTKKNTCYKLQLDESGIITDENKSGELCQCD